jgi:hypothetical protein
VAIVMMSVHLQSAWRLPILSGLDYLMPNLNLLLDTLCMPTWRLATPARRQCNHQDIVGCRWGLGDHRHMDQGQACSVYSQTNISPVWLAGRRMFCL